MLMHKATFKEVISTVLSQIIKSKVFGMSKDMNREVRFF